jgi:hypothetical protein
MSGAARYSLLCFFILFGLFNLVVGGARAVHPPSSLLESMEKYICIAEKKGTDLVSEPFNRTQKRL